MRFGAALAASATLAAAVHKPLPKRAVYNPQSFILGDGGAVCYEGLRKDMEAWLFALTKEASTSEFFSTAKVIEGSCQLRDYSTPVDMEEGAQVCGHKVTTYLDRDLGHQKLWLKMEAKKKAASAINTMCKEAFEYWQDPEIEAELKDKSDSVSSFEGCTPGEPCNLPSPEMLAKMVQGVATKVNNQNAARRLKRWRDNFEANHTREKELERWHAKQDAAKEKARKMLETAKNDVMRWGGLPATIERAMKDMHEKVEECLKKWFMIHGEEQPSPDVIKQCYRDGEEALPDPAVKKKATERHEREDGKPLSASDSLADKLKAQTSPHKEAPKTKKEIMTSIGKAMEQGFKDMFAPKKKGEPLQATPEKAMDDFFKAVKQAQDAGIIQEPKPLFPGLMKNKKPKSKPEEEAEEKLSEQAQALKSLKDMAEAMKQFPSPPIVGAKSDRAKIVKKMAGNLEVGQLERSKQPGAMGDHPQPEVVKEALEAIPGSYEKTMKAMEPAKALHSEAEFMKAIGRALASGLRTKYMQTPTSQGGVLSLARGPAAGAPSNLAFVIQDDGATCHQGAEEDVAKFLVAVQYMEGAKDHYANAVINAGTCGAKDYNTVLEMRQRDAACQGKIATFLDRDTSHHVAWMQMEKSHEGALTKACHDAFEGTPVSPELKKHFAAADAASKAAWNAVSMHAANADNSSQTQIYKEVLAKAADAAAKSAWNATLQAALQHKAVDKDLIAKETKQALHDAAQKAFTQQAQHPTYDAEKAKAVADWADKQRAAAEQVQHPTYDAEKAKAVADWADKQRAAAEQAQHPTYDAEKAKAVADWADKQRAAAEQAQKAKAVADWADKQRAVAEQAQKAKADEQRAAEQAQKAKAEEQRAAAEQAQKAKADEQKAAAAAEQARKAKAVADWADQQRAVAEQAQKAKAEEQRAAAAAEQARKAKAVADWADKQRAAAEQAQQAKADEQRAATEQKQEATSAAQQNQDVAAAVGKAAKAIFEQALAGKGSKASNGHGRWRNKMTGAAVTTYGHLRHDGTFDGAIFGSYAGTGVHAVIGSNRNSTHRRMKIGGAAGNILGSLSRHFTGEFPISDAKEGKDATTAVSTDNELKITNNAPITFKDEIRSTPFHKGETAYQGSATLAVPGTSVSGNMDMIRNDKAGSVGRIGAEINTPEYKGPFLFNLGFGSPAKAVGEKVV